MKLRALLMALFLPVASWAHEDHCHVKGDDGKLADAKDAKDKKGCTAKGGTWFHHHTHCHAPGADGGIADVPAAKDEKSCAAKGGTWTDHGHDEEKK